MEVSSLLTNEHSPTRKQSEHSHRVRSHGGSRASQGSNSPNNVPKKVAFELLLDEGSKTRARIPMRVLINPHDTIESIVTTVKNFYGIYEGHGISFEDDKGNTLIARHENFVNDTVVYVRTVAGPQPAPNHASQGFSGFEMQRRTSLGEPFQMLPPQAIDYNHSPSRPMSRLARKRSTSPQLGRGRRSSSRQKTGSMSNTASRGSSAHGSYQDDGDSDGGQSSITGSKKARSEQFASAEISLENVLKDGRRTGPSFDSSVSLPFSTDFTAASDSCKTIVTVYYTAGVAKLVLIVSITGITTIRSSSSAFDDIDVFDLSTATLSGTRGPIALCSPSSKALPIHSPAIAITSA